MNGNVGVGTAPGAKLVVQGAAAELHVKNDATNAVVMGGFDGTSQWIKSINLGIALTPLTLQSSRFTFDTGNVGIGTPSPIANLDVNGSVQFNKSNDIVKRFIIAVTRSLGATAGSFVNIGSINSNGKGTYTTIYESHHDCGTVNSSVFEIRDTYYAGSTVDWVQVPTQQVQSHTGAQDVAIDVRRTVNFAPLEVRIRNLGGPCGVIDSRMEIQTNGTFVPDSTAGSGATVAAGYLSSNAYQFPVSNDRFKASTDGIFILNSGYIGLGTTAPNDLLSIGLSGAAAPAGSASTGHNYTNSYLSTDNYALTNYGLVKTLIAGGAGSSVGYWTMNGTNINNTNSGNVGVGTANPLAKLQVDAGYFATNFNAGGVYPPYASVYSSIGWNFTAGGGEVDFWNTNNGLGSKRGFAFRQQTAAGAQTELMRIEGATGNVGIGTTNPVAKLDLFSPSAVNGPMLSIRSDFTAIGKYAMIRFGDQSQTTNYQKGAIIYEGVAGSARGRFHIALNNDDTSNSVALSDARLTVQSDGNVGIGTTGPTRKLQVAGDMRVDGMLDFNGISDSKYLKMTTDGLLQWKTHELASGHGFEILNSASSPIVHLDINGNSYLNGGNVGIGTNAPSAKLEVAGQFKLQDSSAIYPNQTSGGSIFEYPYVYTITVGGDPNTYYPVSLIAAGNGTVPGKFAIARAYYEAGPVVAGGDAGHIGGLQAVFSTMNTGWSDYTYLTLKSLRQVYVRTIADCSMLPTESTGRPLSCRLRGGGFVYHIYSNYPISPNQPTPGGIAYSSGPYTFYYPDALPLASLPSNVFQYDTDVPVDVFSPILFVSRTTGNVGINTTVPNDTFSIGNAGAAPAGSAKTGHNYTMTYLSNDGYALLNYGTANTLIAGANLWSGTKDGTIWNGTAGAGNVGVGTTNTAGYQLNVNGYFHSNGFDDSPTYPYTKSMFNGADAGTVYLQAGSTGNTFSKIIVAGDTAGTGIQFLTRNTEIMRISNTGNVGVGTTAPGAKLDVNGTTWFRGAVYADSINHYSGSVPLALGSGGLVNILTNGNVGIGTTAPNDSFSIGNAGAAPAGSARTGHNYTMTYLSNDGYALVNYGTVQTLIANATSSMLSGGLWNGTLNGNIWNGAAGAGNVGIGTTAPQQKLDVMDSSAVTTYPLLLKNNFDSPTSVSKSGIRFARDNGTPFAEILGGQELGSNFNYGQLQFRTRTTDVLGVETKMTITAAGNVGIATTTPSEKLEVNGNVKAVAFIYSSDRNLKQNIVTIQTPLEKIMQLRGVTFDWKKDNSPSIGLIAQEVEKVFPELVTGQEGSKAVAYGNLVAPLIEAVKEQQTEIKDNKEEIAKLKAQQLETANLNKTLLNRLKSLEAKGKRK